MQTFRRIADRALTVLLVGLLRALIFGLRLLGARRASALGGFLARKLGPLLPVHRRVGLANLAIAFPDRGKAEHEAILRGVWDNLGRTVAEYPFLPELIDHDPFAELGRRGETEAVGTDHFFELKRKGGPAVIFSAHLGNWELMAVTAAQYGLALTAMYRPPNSPVAAALVNELRARASGKMLPSNFGAALMINEVMDRGGMIGMLADQHFTRGMRADFLGRPAMTNPMLARLARRYDCPMHGARCVRLPNGQFRLEITPALELPRFDDGSIDVAGTVALMNAVIAGWVREHPEQWLWLHRRWRAPPLADGGDQVDSPGARTT